MKITSIDGLDLFRFPRLVQNEFGAQVVPGLNNESRRWGRYASQMHAQEDRISTFVVEF